MFKRILTTLAAAPVAGALLVLTWPQLFGLEDTVGVAHVVSLRGLAVALAVVTVIVLTLLSRIRPLRRMAASLAVLVALFAVANAGILAMRGIGPKAAAAEPADPVTVLSWNTLGDAPGAAAIARLALDEGADIVALPETTEDTGVAVAEAMRAGGRPMWVHTIAFDLVSKARSTTLLISPDLGDYRVSNTAGSGPPGNTNVLPSVVATPVDGAGPTVVAVHAVSPIRGEMSNWRSDLDWLAAQCGGGSVIMAGDFNATLDHMAHRAASDSAALGHCLDAASAAGTAGVGTWPAKAPALLGSPIDHVMSTGDWRVRGMRVIESSDGAGSDHRPIVARLVPGA